MWRCDQIETRLPLPSFNSCRADGQPTRRPSGRSVSSTDSGAAPSIGSIRTAFGSNSADYSCHSIGLTPGLAGDRCVGGGLAPLKFRAGSSGDLTGRIRGATTTGTFTIVATDGTDWGVAVASRALAVGAMVPAVESQIGAIATQAQVNVAWKAEGLALLRRGEPARAVVDALVKSDAAPGNRQLAVLDGQGQVAAYTGPACRDWAGHIEGEGFVAAGNILAGEGVLAALAESFRSSQGELARRLVEALQAGDMAGGDSRGKQSAAVVVARFKGGIEGLDDRLLDLRVDDHPQPVPELLRLVELGVAAYRQGFADPPQD